MRWLRDMWRRDVWRRDCNRWWNVHPGWWADGFPVIDKREWFRQSDLQDILASSNWALRRDLRDMNRCSPTYYHDTEYAREQIVKILDKEELLRPWSGNISSDSDELLRCGCDNRLS